MALAEVVPFPAAGAGQEDYRAQHLFGCRLEVDHPGACLLERPFRLLPEGGREYLDRVE